MKHFNIYGLLVLALGLLMIGCEGDNYDITETETTESEPTELQGTGISGIIMDSDGGPIVNAEIVIHHQDKEILVSTDERGAYVVSLPSTLDTAFLQATAQEYVTSSIASVELVEGDNKKDMTLLQSEELPYLGSVQALGAANTLATISGQILLADGSPAAFYRVVLVDLIEVINGNFVFTYVVTDDYGFYSISHEPFSNFSLLVFDDCIEKQQVDYISQQLSLEDEDLKLGVFQSTLGEVPKVQLSGFITNCETGEGVEEAWMTIKLNSSQFTDAVDVIDGFYEIELMNCTESTCLDINIFGRGSNTSFNSFDCVEISGPDMIFDHMLCGDERLGEGEIFVILESDTLIYENAKVEIMDGPVEGITISSVVGPGNFIAISSKGTEVGVHDIYFLDMQRFSILNYNALADSGFQFVIDRIDEYITGSFSGVVTDNDDNEVPIQGYFDIKI